MLFVYDLSCGLCHRFFKGRKVSLYFLLVEQELSERILFR